MLMLSGTIAAAILSGLPTDHASGDDGNPRNGVVFVAPMGIFIPLNHNGLAFMNDAPSVAIDMFEPDAEVALNEFALLSQNVELLDLEIGRDGKVRAVTLNLPGFPRIDGEIPVKSLLIKPDGTVEFSPMAADSQEFCRLILTTDPITGGVDARCIVIDCDGMCEMIAAVLPGGGFKLSCACLSTPPGDD